MSGMRTHRRPYGYVDLVQSIRDDHIAIHPSAVVLLPPNGSAVIAALLQRQRIEIGQGAAAAADREVSLEQSGQSGPSGWAVRQLQTTKSAASQQI
jgi:hypothetical protein